MEGSQPSAVRPSGKSTMCMEMGVERWWDGPGRGKQEYWEKNMSRCQFVHQKSHIDLPGIEPGLPR